MEINGTVNGRQIILIVEDELLIADNLRTNLKKYATECFWNVVPKTCRETFFKTKGFKELTSAS